MFKRGFVSCVRPVGWSCVLIIMRTCLSLRGHVFMIDCVCQRDRLHVCEMIKKNLRSNSGVDGIKDNIGNSQR